MHGWLSVPLGAGVRAHGLQLHQLLVRARDGRSIGYNGSRGPCWVGQNGNARFGSLCMDTMHTISTSTHCPCRLTNQLRFMPGGDGSSCASSSYDGTVKV